VSRPLKMTFFRHSRESGNLEVTEKTGFP
jgi:hypothetical protein